MKRRLAVLAVLGCLLAGCGGSEGGQAAPPDAIVMTSNAFEPPAHAIKQGDTVTFKNETTGALHILVLGEKGLAKAEPGAPDIGGSAGHRSERGDVWTTPAWSTAGSYHITCTVHPAMTLTINVA
jgi:plastocyanin